MKLLRQYLCIVYWIELKYNFTAYVSFINILHSSDVISPREAQKKLIRQGAEISLT